MGSGRIGVDEGLALIREHVRLLGSETLPVVSALGRVVATPVISNRSVPGFRAAAMDGFAVRSEDLHSASADRPVILSVVAHVAAGDAPPPILQGQAVIIGTGARIPVGADAVVMIEHVRAYRNHRDEQALFDTSARPGLNIREIGEDAEAGRRVLEIGALVTPDVIGGLLSYGVTDIEVVQIPTLALLVTGSELAGQGDGAPAAVVDSNGPMIAAMATELGLQVAGPKIVPDDVDIMHAAIANMIAGPSDIMVTTGGASKGERDLVRSTLEALGARIWFHGLSMRPGKPLLFATLPDGRPVFGLPGNPVSANVAMRFFVTGAIRAMQGRPPEQGMLVATTEAGREGLTLFLRSNAPAPDAPINGDLDQRSHILSSLMVAEFWRRIDREGDCVRCLFFSKTPAR